MDVNAWYRPFLAWRRGKIGSWHDEFDPLTKAIFKDVAGDLLIELGSESGYDW